MARVVVVGAGLGGLAVAVRLAKQRHVVTVCEQAEQAGGMCGRFSRDGFTFDTGPHLLTLPIVYRQLFFRTGAPIDEVLDLDPVDPSFHYRFADGVEVDVPNVSRSRIAAAWDEALGGGAGAEWQSFLNRGARIWDTVQQQVLSSPLEGPRDLLRPSRRVEDLRTIAPWRSLRGLGRQYLKHPHLRTVLDRYATYTGSDPRRAPAALATVAYMEQSFGAWHVRGGLHRLADALLVRAGERGVTVRTGADVVEVLQDAGRVCGVRLADGERLDADIVVANSDARHLYRDLVSGPVAAAALTSLRRVTASMSGFVLMLALRDRTPGLRHHTVLFGGDYDDEFDAVFGTGPYRRRGPVPVPDPTIYLSTPDDPALRPDDAHEAMFVLVNAPRHIPAGDPEAERPTPLHRAAGIDWDAPGLAHSYADRILALMAERGVDVRERILWRQVRTPADLARATRAPGGSIYGSSSNGARATFLRPANRSPIPGLFLVGGSAHPGGGVPLVGLSAAIVAGQIGRA
jgi:phytoene desaturase